MSSERLIWSPRRDRPIPVLLIVRTFLQARNHLRNIVVRSGAGEGCTGLGDGHDHIGQVKSRDVVYDVVV